MGAGRAEHLTFMAADASSPAYDMKAMHNTEQVQAGIHEQQHGGRPLAPAVYTRIVMYGGSTLIALGGPDEIWQSRRHGHLSVRLLGGGLACFPAGEVESMFLHRRPRRGEQVATVAP